jgi:hypothetical protein
MHGVPPDLPLASFVGHECNQIALGVFQIQFHFAGAGSIFVESRWELRDAAESLVDGWCEHAGRDCYRVHKIIGVPVNKFCIDAPYSFTLYFESGHSLSVFDESEAYESFQLDVVRPWRWTSNV